MTMIIKCCGNCKWCKFDEKNKAFKCCHPTIDHEWVLPDCECEAWEEQ